MTRCTTRILTAITVVFALLVVAPVTATADDDDLDDAYAQYLDGDVDFDGPQPVTDTFGEIVLINSPTVEQVPVGRLRWNIQHRMGPFEMDTSNLFGVYAPGNIRLGFYYGLHDRVQLGLGATQAGSRFDANTKVQLIEQHTEGWQQVSVSYFGQMTLQGGDADRFDRFSHRIGYLHELLVARKFSDDFSLQASLGLTHKNVVDTREGYRNDNLAASLAGKYNLNPNWAINFEAGQGQLLSWVYPSEDGARSYPILGLGVEYFSSAHGFQVFLSSTNDILTGPSYVFNSQDIREGNLFVGFNITRDWTLH